MKYRGYQDNPREAFGIFEEDLSRNWFLHRAIPLTSEKWLKEYKYDDFNDATDSLFSIEYKEKKSGYNHKFIIPKYFDGMKLELVEYDKLKDKILLHTKDCNGNYIYGWDYDENIPEFKKIYMELEKKVLCEKEEKDARRAIKVTRIRYKR